MIWCATWLRCSRRWARGSAGGGRPGIGRSKQSDVPNVMSGRLRLSVLAAMMAAMGKPSVRVLRGWE